MYSLVSAIAKSFSSEGRWTAVKIGNLTFDTLFSQYTKIVAVLTNPFVEGQVALNLADIRSRVGSPAQTFSDFLTANGNATLPTSTTIPVLAHHTVRYKDAFKAGYSVTPVTPNAAPDAQFPPSDKTWLYLDKPGVNFRTFQDYCLVSVNGFLHRVDADENGAWIVEGNRSHQISGKAACGIYNFQKVSKFHYVPITADMIYKQRDDQAYRNHMYVNLGEDISNKSVMLVLGGYLAFADPKTFFRINSTSVCIDFNNLSLFERIHESWPYLDFSSLPFQRSARNPMQFDINDFLSDENLVAYATLPQSFFVVLDNVELFRDETYVQTQDIPNKLVAYQEPTAPLLNGIGKLAEYWSVEENGQWILTVGDNHWHRRLYNTTPLLLNDGITDDRIPTDPVRFSRGKFLLIGTDLEQPA